MRDERGTALMEFALALPMLVLLLIGSFDLFEMLLMTQKCQRLAATLGDIVAQADDPLRAAQVDALFAAGSHVLEPFDHAAGGRAMVSAVVLNSSGVPMVAWQRIDGGALAATSRVGAAGGAAVLPAGLPLRTGETVIVAEAFQSFSPAFVGSVLPARTVYEAAYYRPRLGNLASLSP